jgi:hypothetical protein
MREGTSPHVLREYALLADGQRGALCGPNGDIVWLCAPRWHDDAVFTALLGGAGVYSVRPAGSFVWGGYYEAGSLMWHHRWITHSGTVECRDALAFPGDPDRAVLLREVCAVDEETTVEVTLNVRAAFGREPMEDLRRDEDGRWTGRSGQLHLRWTGMRDARLEGDVLTGHVRLRAGQRRCLILELAEHQLEDVVDAAVSWQSTEAAWQRAVPTFDRSIAPGDTRHAYAVLRGLTVPGGGMAAAATMSLPEHAEQGRNYDYRYSWIRDQCYAGIAVAAHGDHELLNHALTFVTGRLHQDGAAIKPAYCVTGENVPEERSVDLPGYPGGQETFTGNKITGQFQLDALGEALQLLAAGARYDRLHHEGRQAARLAIAAVQQRWNEPEAGIWELEDDWWTQSRLACVAGLRAIAAAPQFADDAADAERLADTILAETSRRCLHPSGRWQQTPDRDVIDAALLLPGVRGALPPSDPRMIATLQAVRNELAEDGFVYRYPHNPHQLGSVEGAFLLTGFFTSLAEWYSGDRLAAIRHFERNRSACGPPGLLAEEYDVRQRQLRGNLPQAFVHALLLETSVRLAE